MKLVAELSITSSDEEPVIHSSSYFLLTAIRSGDLSIHVLVSVNSVHDDR